MIITRTPMRISLGGGGTDLPSHYRVSGGFLVAAAISRHVYIAVNRNFDDDILLKYSHIEKVARVADVRHPLLREALRLAGV
ncbi:MAG TPA: galactokinase, partial [Actinomycetota bacterium]|nr:galactokinase [Actinomycetota bacterium]